MSFSQPDPHSQSYGRGPRRPVLPRRVLLVAAAALAFLLVLALRSRRPHEPAGPQPLDLAVRSDPPGASVFLDGRFVGISPLAVRGVEPGEHHVRFEKSGRQAVRKRVQVARDAARIDVKLDAVPTGSLHVASKPPGAQIHLDGEMRGLTPITIKDLAAGEHTLLLRKTNREKFSQVVEIVPGRTSRVNAVLPDRIERFLLAAIESEPESISNYTDLAHYYFINEQMEKAVEHYKKAMARCGKSNKGKECQRLRKELKKHRKMRGPHTHRFNRMLERAEADLKRRR